MYLLSNRDKITAPTYDQGLLWIVLMLLGFGLVMVYSASIALAEADKATGHQSTYFAVRHAVYLVVALMGGFIAFQVPTRYWQQVAPYLFLIGLVLLVLVLIPGVGRQVNGSQRWIPLGFANLQPSELMKLFATIYAADYTVRKAAMMDSFTKSFLPMLGIMLLVGLLLLSEPDFGAFSVVATITISILWLGGMNLRIFSGMMVLLISGVGALRSGSGRRRLSSAGPARRRRFTAN